MIPFVIIPAADIYPAFTMGQPCPVDDLTDFFMRWALARLFYKEEIETWNDEGMYPA